MTGPRPQFPERPSPYLNPVLSEQKGLVSDSSELGVSRSRLKQKPPFAKDKSWWPLSSQGGRHRDPLLPGDQHRPCPRPQVQRENLEPWTQPHCLVLPPCLRGFERSLGISLSDFPHRKPAGPMHPSSWPTGRCSDRLILPSNSFRRY